MSNKFKVFWSIGTDLHIIRSGVSRNFGGQESNRNLGAQKFTMFFQEHFPETQSFATSEAAVDT